MNPWTIIGWGIIAGAAILLVLGTWRYLLFPLWFDINSWRIYRSTRNVKPAKGQSWMVVSTRDELCPTRYHIEDVNGDSIRIRWGATSWTDTHAEWTDRVKSERLYWTNS